MFHQVFFLHIYIEFVECGNVCTLSFFVAISVPPPSRHFYLFIYLFIYFYFPWTVLNTVDRIRTSLTKLALATRVVQRLSLKKKKNRAFLLHGNPNDTVSNDRRPFLRRKIDIVPAKRTRRAVGDVALYDTLCLLTISFSFIFYFFYLFIYSFIFFRFIISTHYSFLFISFFFFQKE